MSSNATPIIWGTSLFKKTFARASVIAPLFTKVAKHLAVLACLMIVGTATGRTALGSFAIFLMIIAATLAHLFGRAVEKRRAALLRLPKFGP